MKPIKINSVRLLAVAVAVLAVGAAATLCTGHGPGGGYSYSPGRGDTVNVAIAYSPMSMYRYGDTLGGLNYDLLRALASAYGDNFKYWPVSGVAGPLEELAEGKYDMLVADIPVTASLRSRFRVSVPVYTDRLVLVQHPGSGRDTVTSPLQLGGRDVWVVDGSPSYERLENLGREIGDSIHLHTIEGCTAEHLVMLVALGDIPLAVVNEEVAHSLKGEYPGLVLDTRVSMTQFQSWLFNRKDSVLADSIDAQIERLRLTPVYDSIVRRWTCADGNHVGC